MSDKRIVICDLDHADVETERAIFDKAGYDFDWLHCVTQDDVINSCQNAEVLLNLYIRMDRKIFKALPKLRCIVRYGVGVDNVNLPDADEFGVQICNVPDYGTREVADHALSLTMCLARKIAFSNSLIRNGVWDYTREIPIHRMSESTVGLFGIGRIGREYAARVHAMGCRVIACDPYVKGNAAGIPDYVEMVSWEELLAQADILSVHCPRTPDTYHIFSRPEFEKMKKSAYIINVSRGGIIDEDALFWALSSGEIAGGALDVVENEPLRPDDPLLSCQNFIATPHTAWYSEESAQELNRKVAEEAVRFMKGEPVRYPVNHPKKK